MGMRLRVLCEPRGFTRLFLQFTFSLVTIVRLAQYDEQISVNINCKPLSENFSAKDIEVIAEVKYPFSFKNIEYRACKDDVPESESEESGETSSGSSTNSGTKPLIDNKFDKSYKSESMFFMSMTVITLLFSLFLTIYYVFLEQNLLKSAIPGRLIDYYGSIAMSVLTLIAAIVFSVASNGLQKYATAKQLSTRIEECSEHLLDGEYRTTCSHGRAVDKSGIFTVCILGYMNVLIWLFTVWFSFKETRPDKRV